MASVFRAVLIRPNMKKVAICDSSYVPIKISDVEYLSVILLFWCVTVAIVKVRNTSRRIVITMMSLSCALMVIGACKAAEQVFKLLGGKVCLKISQSIDVEFRVYNLYKHLFYNLTR